MLYDQKTLDGPQLWNAVQSGSYEAFDELMRRYWQPVFNNAYKRVQSMDVCEDLVQDLFLNLWLKRESLDIINPEAYLMTAIRYRVYSYFSRNSFSKDMLELFEDITGTRDSDSKLRVSELQKLVRAWIETLPSKRQKIFSLYLEKHLSTSEIALELNISQKTVQNQLNRSMPDLRSRLRGQYPVWLLFI